MNRTNFEHAGYALLIQLAVGLLAWNLWVGAAAGAFFFLGREHSQAQEHYKLGDWAAFDVRKWSLDARYDLLFPVVAVTTVALLAKVV